MATDAPFADQEYLDRYARAMLGFELGDDQRLGIQEKPARGS